MSAVVSAPVLLAGQLGDFHWPPGVAGPASHRVGWRKEPGRAGDVLAIRGNRSLYTVLAQRILLPEHAAFLLPSHPHLAGMLRVKEFVNAQVAPSHPTFVVGEEVVSLAELVGRAGWQAEGAGAFYVRGQGGGELASRVLVCMGETVTSLAELTDHWKRELVRDSEGMVEEVEEPKKQRVRTKAACFSFLKSQGMETSDGGLVCVYCGFVCYELSSKTSFINHMGTHIFRDTKKVKRTKRSMPCTECGKIYKEVSLLKRHVKKVHDIDMEAKIALEECLFCKTMVPGKSLQEHILREHKKDKITCQYCDKTYNSQNKMKMHIGATHERKNAGFCEVCQKEYLYIRNHMNEKHNSEQLKCTHCEKTFKHKQSLNLHMRSVNGTLTRKTCPECQKSVVSLHYHMRIVHQGWTRSSKHCHNCKTSFPVAKFEEHKAGCHRDFQTCCLCSKKVRNLEHHLGFRHSQVACGFCGDNFANGKGGNFAKGNGGNLLRNHIYDIHMESLCAELNITESITTENVKIRDAITQRFVEKKSVPEGSRFKCTICSKLFGTMVQMYSHMKYHLKYMSHKPSEYSPCTECGKMVRRSKLGQHNCLGEVPTNPRKKISLKPKENQEPNSVEKNSATEELVNQVEKKQDSDNAGLLEMHTLDYETSANSENVEAKYTNFTALDKHNANKENENSTVLWSRTALPSQKRKPSKPSVCPCPGCQVPPCGVCGPCTNKALRARCRERNKCEKRTRKVARDSQKLG